MNIQPALIDTKIRDPDLIKRLEEAGVMRPIVYNQCVTEQLRRDALLHMPSVKRRRSVIRHRLEEQGGNSRDNIRHIHSVLAVCSLPYTRQPLEVREWNRTQGRMKLSVTAGKLMSPDGEWIDQPLPYGSRARLMLLHVCSEAIRTNSPVVHIEDSLCEFIKALGFPVTGGKNGTINSFKQQINALTACTLHIGAWDGEKGRTIKASPFSSLAVEMFTTTPNQRTLWPTELNLSLDFFQTLTKHALPINLHAARAFANSPRKLDLIFWLGYRLHTLREPLAISWEKLTEQWGQNYARFANFKRDFALELSEIKEVFPKLPIVLNEHGCVISPGSSEVLALPTRK